MDEDAGARAEAVAFGTDGWRATLDEFTDDRVRMVGQAVATYLTEAGETDAVAVGYDAREHSRGFAEELSRVLCANGFDVVVPERDVPTPVVAWTVRDRDLAGALMITASHNPPEYNGVKFVPGDGAPALPEVTDEIEANLAEPDPLPEDEWGDVEEADLVGPYLDHALAFADDVREARSASEPASGGTARAAGRDLGGLRVAYDAMHGSGRGVTDELLARAGADVERLRCETDPDFGGGAPEPVPERAAELVERVTAGEADLGVINDGDSDRVAVVTPDRGFLDPNLFFATLYDDLLAGSETRSVSENAGGGPASQGDVVRTVSTSSIVDRVAEAHDQAVHETAVGFKWVAAAMGEHDALLGGEESGGFGVTAHLRNKDGVLVGLLAAAAEADEPLDERVDRLLAEYGEIHQGRISVDCPDDRKATVLQKLEGDLPETLAGEAIGDVSTVDGFKLTLADGTWILVRPSGTEPKLRVYAEAGGEERVDDLLAAGRDVVEPLV